MLSFYHHHLDLVIRRHTLSSKRAYYIVYTSAKLYMLVRSYLLDSSLDIAFLKYATHYSVLYTLHRQISFNFFFFSLFFLFYETHSLNYDSTRLLGLFQSYVPASPRAGHSLYTILDSVSLDCTSLRAIVNHNAHGPRVRINIMCINSALKLKLSRQMKPTGNNYGGNNKTV